MEHLVIIKHKPPSYITDAKAWCCKQFSEGYRDNDKWAWKCYWDGPSVEYGTQHKFWFREHKDAMMFSLRWE